MGADYVVHLPCSPKLSLGDGDPVVGTQALLDMVKSRNRARVLAEQAEGRDPSTLELTLVRSTPEGLSEEKIKYTDLVAQAAPLETHASACRDCPASFLGGPFGCYGALPYPVSAAGERWLVSRLQPTSTPGGFLLREAIRDFGYDGAPNRPSRASGMYELRKPAENVIEKKLFGSTRVTGDQLFQAFFHVGPALDPGHCGGLLLWLGALEIDGRVPASAADVPLLQAMMAAETPEERRRVATLSLGARSPELEPVHDLLRGVYAAWVLGVPLLIDA